ncbi:hypothetical protein AB0E81_31680 [Streptomyces sp. NPDC033538]|uniref:hypothetical protein n=1 Tax=Streptomyces sp. NPDC033538 TaxID=3155367 RepID=UPI0033DF2570
MFNTLSPASPHQPAAGRRAHAFTGRRARAPLQRRIQLGGDPPHLAVSCRGTGTIEVSVPVLGTSFPLECGTAEPAVTYNQLAMSSAHKAGTVAVTAPSSVTWALTVGRGNAAEEDIPTTG